jgi:hypothetical protein
MNGVYLSAATGGGSITLFAGNAAATASSHTALLSYIARNMRVREKLYRKGIAFTVFIACGRRFARRQYLFITGGGVFHTQGKSIKNHTIMRGARLIVVMTVSRAPFFYVSPGM